MNRTVNKTLSNKNKKKRKLQWSMVRTLLFGWFLPLLFLSITMAVVVYGRIQDRVKDTVVTSFDSAMEICHLSVTDVINSSKNASYDNIIKESYYEYLKTNNDVALSSAVRSYLQKSYRFNTNFVATILYFENDSDALYHTFNAYSGGGYQSITWFKENAKEEVDKIAAEIGTATVFVNVNGRTYMVRNLVKGNFEPYAVLAMELNVQHIFKALTSVWGSASCEVYMNGVPIFGSSKEGLKELNIKEDIEKTMLSYSRKKNLAYVYKSMKHNGLKFTYVVKLDSQMMVGDMHSINSFFQLQIVFMIPLIFLVFYFFHNRVTRPINDLLKATNEIKDGNYGLQIKQTGKNQEFDELDKAFNAMSAKLQYQFQKIYLEELAVRDARIMALQSQINPHFLNNTLEIINWEARMNDNFKVSRMIEALSTMLEATMNRKNQSFISLAEELNYLDAYLFIISQRFGEKFQAIKNIDESLLGIEVPRLIIQPIIENAVEHGTNLQKKTIVTINVYSKDEFILIEIINNKAMTPKDRENIERLLSESYIQEKQGQNGQHVSLGIRNVNQRIKKIYGRDCGLRVNTDSLGNTISTIIVKTYK